MFSECFLLCDITNFDLKISVMKYILLQLKVQSFRLSNMVQTPCRKGLRNGQQKSCFLLILPVLPQVSLAQTVTIATTSKVRELHKELLPWLKTLGLSSQTPRPLGHMSPDVMLQNEVSVHSVLKPRHQKEI